jgi:dephospho-CoA kinase
MGHVLVIDATIEPNFQRLMQRIAQNSQKSVDATGS